MKTLIMKSLVTFTIVFVVTIVVTFLYSLILHNSYSIDWETSFRLAIILAVVFPVLGIIENKRKVIK